MAKHRGLRIAAIGLLVLFALLGGLYCAGFLRQSRETRHPLYKDIPNERLKYEVTSWLGESGIIRVDTSPLTKLPDGRSAYRVTYSLETAPKVAALYVLAGQVSVLIDAATLLPIEYEEAVTSGLGLTGGTKKHTKLVYDQAKHQICYYREKEDGKGLELARTRTIPPDAQHFTSFIFYLQDLTLKVGQDIAATMSDRRKEIAVKVSVLREDEYVGLAGEKRKAFVLQTMSDFGKEAMKDAGYLIWLDKDGGCIARIDAKTSLGTISAKLVKRTLANGTPTPTDEDSGNHSRQVPVDPPAGKAAP